MLWREVEVKLSWSWPLFIVPRQGKAARGVCTGPHNIALWGNNIILFVEREGGGWLSWRNWWPFEENDWEIYNLNHFKFYFPCSFRGVSWWKWVIIWIFKRHLNDQCHQRRQQGILGETPFWDNLFSSPLTCTHVAHANIRKYFRNTCHTNICLCKIKRGGGWLSLRNWWAFKKKELLKHDETDPPSSQTKMPAGTKPLGFQMHLLLTESTLLTVFST